MIRRQLLALTVMSSLVCGIALSITAFAQDPKGQGANQKNANANQNQNQNQGDSSTADPSQRINKALEAYREKVGQSEQRTRGEIQRLRKELVELIDMRYDMSIALAEIRADLSMQQTRQGPGPAFSPAFRSVELQQPGQAGQAGGQTDDPSGQAGQQGSGDEQQRMRNEILNRELQSVLQQLSGDVDRARAQADQTVAQLRNLKAQLRQQQEQEKANRERIEKAKEAASSSANRDQNSQNAPNPDQGQGKQGQSKNNANQGATGKANP